MSASKPVAALVPSWRAPLAGHAPLMPEKAQPWRKPVGPVTYTQSNGADVFPAVKWLRSLFGSHKP